MYWTFNFLLEILKNIPTKVKWFSIEKKFFLSATMAITFYRFYSIISIYVSFISGAKAKDLKSPFPSCFQRCHLNISLMQASLHPDWRLTISKTRMKIRKIRMPLTEFIVKNGDWLCFEHITKLYYIQGEKTPNFAVGRTRTCAPRGNLISSQTP